MKLKASRKERFQYWFDNQFSRGPKTLIMWLAVTSLILISLVAVFVSILKISPPGEGPLSFGEAFWRSLMRTLDAGTMGGDEGFWFRIAMFVVTLGGVFVISTLIGILTAGVEAKLENLRKGRSRVLESNHVILLGWTEQIFTILNELMEANSNLPGAVLVVMGAEEKTTMEDAIAQRVIKKGKTHIVCRQGNPMELTDLNMVSIDSSRAIIILSPGGEDADNQVIKTVLAVTNHPQRDRSHRLHIVAEIVDPANMDAARVVGNGEVEWILVGDFIARIIAQTCRQSGLSVIYNELLDFGGDEIYFKTQPELTGKTFDQALLAYPKNAVMGLCPAGSEPKLNPPMETILQPGDQLILMAQDDDKIFFRPEQVTIQTEAIATRQAHPGRAEKALVLGWNHRGPAVVHELDQYARPGSKVLIVTDNAALEQEMADCCSSLHNQAVSFLQGQTTDRKLLESLHLEEFDHIIVLCYSDQLDIQQADARTLITLLHLRDIAARSNTHFSIVSEMLDVRNRNLAVVTGAGDFIVSDRLVSLMMSQVAENPHLNLVFQDLFDPEGSEIYLKPVSEFLQTGIPVNFYTVIEAARRYNAIALGYRLRSESNNGDMMYGIHLNPLKTDTVVFTPEDRIIVLAEEE